MLSQPKLTTQREHVLFAYGVQIRPKTMLSEPKHMHGGSREHPVGFCKVRNTAFRVRNRPFSMIYGRFRTNPSRTPENEN